MSVEATFWGGNAYLPSSSSLSNKVMELNTALGRLEGEGLRHTIFLSNVLLVCCSLGLKTEKRFNSI
jgi:hypothetical protein